ncbi:MAG: hypothetical protein ABIS69_08930 [Sediminibacterium sp.]
MNKLQKSSIYLLSIAGLIGLIRGTRMALYPNDNSLLFPYPEEMIKASIFTNYFILGLIVFVLAGLFSLVAIAGILYKIRNYAYLIIVEGIFTSFFILTHVLYAGFSFIHFILLPMSVALIVIGILQTPKDF